MRNIFALTWTVTLSVLAITNAERKADCQLPCPVCRARPPCQDGVALVLDGCRCCPVCARQHGQPCSDVSVCDVTKQLVCDVTGTCRGSTFRGCVVNGTTYRDGQSFFTDCRTRCTCQDGSYACTSLCPHEMIRPSRRCRQPALTVVRGQCCRQWTCADDTAVSRPPCEPLTSDWSPCSASCGGGMSTRISNQNKDCTLLKESRLCQIRECPGEPSWEETLYRMIREDGQVCHPTQRSTDLVHLRWQNCTSAQRYRPTFCTDCHRRCCRPTATLTRSLAFLCDLDRSRAGGDHLWRLGNTAASLPQPETRVARVTHKVMMVTKCECDPCEKNRGDLSEKGDDESRFEGREDMMEKRWEGFKSQQLMGGDIDGDETL